MPQEPVNRLLALLPEEERRHLMSFLEPVELPARRALFEPHRPVEHVWFPLDGMISLVVILEEGASAEIATIGNEGIVGLPVFLDAGSIPVQAISQVHGRALRMSAAAFRAQVPEGSTLHGVLHLYVQALFTQVAQTAACNRFHSVDKRCARWLLQTHDRVGEDEFGLTQEFLAEMIGVRRASVSTTAAHLRRDGLIQYRRGRIRILDRRGLEQCACECYKIIRAEYDRLLA